MKTRKCCICRNEFKPNAGHPRHLCFDPECDKEKKRLRRQGIYKYSCLTCNKVVTLSYSNQKSCYCSDECKPQEPTPAKQKEESLANDLNFPEQQLIQKTFNKMLAAKEPLSQDVDYLISKLLELYPEDHETLYKIGYSLPLHAVLKIASYYGTQLK